MILGTRHSLPAGRAVMDVFRWVRPDGARETGRDDECRK